MECVTAVEGKAWIENGTDQIEPAIGHGLRLTVAT